MLIFDMILYFVRVGAKNSSILEDCAEFFSNELFAWAIEDGYIERFKIFHYWCEVSANLGPVFAAKHPLPTDIKALKTLQKCFIWFDYPYMFHSTEPPIKWICILSENTKRCKRYIPLQNGLAY